MPIPLRGCSVAGVENSKKGSGLPRLEGACGLQVLELEKDSAVSAVNIYGLEGI